MTIIIKMLEKEDLKLDAPAAECLTKYVEQLIRYKNKYFGNARAVRKVIEQIVKNQNLRLASLTIKQRTEKMKHTVSIEDVKEFDIEKDNMLEGGKGQKIGF